MARGLTLLLGLLSGCLVLAAERGVISECKRSLALLEPDLVIYSNEISFVPGKRNREADGSVFFEYVVAADYVDTIAYVEAADRTRKGSNLPMTRSNHSADFVQADTAHEESEFIWYRFDITKLVKESSDDSVTIGVKEYHKRRRQPFPESLELKDDQTLQFDDSRYLLSPYKVLKQATLYRVEKQRLVTFTDDGKGVSHEKEQGGIKYGTYTNTAPYTFDQISLLFKYSDPLLILTEAKKSVTVSHWGNILVDEHFELQNIGASLKGGFSRYEYQYLRHGENCLREISAKYPWYIQGMYFHDFIGNISSTHALRTDTNVDLEYSPRYPICGGWKADWNQGYNVPTKYHLSRDVEDKTLHTLSIDFLHNYDVMATENYTMEFVLPYGARDFKVEAPFELDSQVVESSTETLDFFGKPRLVLTKKDVFYFKHNVQIKLRYRFDERMMLIKPLGLSLTVFMFYLAAIFFNRISFSFSDINKSSVSAKAKTD